MQVSITVRHAKLTPQLKEYATDKISKAQKYFDNVIAAHVILTVEKYYSSAEATVNAGGARINAKEEAQDLYAAIDLMVDNVDRQMKKFKEKIRTNKHHDHRTSDNLLRTEAKIISRNGAEKTGHDLTRDMIKKEFDTTPINAKEAIKRMELTDNDFWAFVNLETNKVNIVYKRSDGTFGLLEPIL
ncbi:MAG: ribosome-associated translation inhibitor RaiA [Elusimicrobia bacterium]|nr:ribosome-associated translation inhibitor RaiA [Elusimicrobiota bacterium]